MGKKTNGIQVGNFIVTRDNGSEHDWISIKAVSGFWSMRFRDDNGMFSRIRELANNKELREYLGQLDMPELSRMKAVLQICDDNDLGKDSVKYAPLFMIETLQEAAYQQMQAEVRQMTASSQLPEAQEQALDECPFRTGRLTV